MQSSTILENHTIQFSEPEKKIAELMLELDQAHLFEAWPEPGQDDHNKHRLLSLLIHINESYPGGLKAYVGNAKTLLAASKRGDNPYEGFTPSVPEGINLDYASEAFREAEALGLKDINKTAFVLVAGGLGERLGYSGIKLALPVETCSGKSFIQHYIERILALEKKAYALTGQDEKIPLMIMTSGDTDTLTRSFLEDHQYFGMDQSQIFILKQEKVPSLINNDAHFKLSDDDPYLIESKPHGHGDVHLLLHQSGLARTWHQAGIKWLVFFQDTNGVVFHNLPAAIGVSQQKDYDMNSLAVDRSAGEAAGAITRLERKDGSSLTINVEYNQLDPLLKATISPEGDVSDDRGLSPFPGNINVLIMKLDNYHKTLEKSGGAVPEFVNPKYQDDSKNSFSKATRLESMMQDIPKLFEADAKIGFTCFERKMCFSAVKNNIQDAAKKAAAQLPPESASTGEADIYYSYAKLLKTTGADIESAPEVDYAGIKVSNAPRIVLSPSFCSSIEEAQRKIKGLKMSANSTLIIEGEHIHIDQLDLDGTLIIKSAPEANVHINGLKIQNQGWEFAQLEEGKEYSEETLIRGYRLIKHDTCELDYPEPGDYTVSD